MARKSNIPNRLSYDNPSYPVSVIYTDLAKSDITKTAWQWHEDIKVIIINNGTAQINSDDQSVRLLPGQAIFIGRNAMHSIRQFGTDACSYYSVTFHPDFILGSESNDTYNSYIEMLSSRSLRLMIFDENVFWHSQILDLLNDVIATNMLKSTAYQLATKGYLCLFINILLNHLEEDAQISNELASPSNDEQRVKAAMSYIREHHAEKINLDDIALHIHVSKSECCRCFKRTVGMTPFEYLMKYRVFEAANQLKEPTHASDSIADIAMAVGFNNFSYFSKLFGKYMNCTPRQYRNDTERHNPSTDLISLR